MSHLIVKSLRFKKDGGAVVTGSDNNVFPKDYRPFNWNSTGENSVRAEIMQQYAGGMIRFMPSANGYKWSYVFSKLDEKLPSYDAGMEAFESLVPEFKRLEQEASDIRKKKFIVSVDGRYLSESIRQSTAAIYPVISENLAAQMNGLQACFNVSQLRKRWPQSKYVEMIERPL